MDVLAVGVEGSDGGPRGAPGGSGSEERHEGFVDVDYVEAFGVEDASHLPCGFHAHGDAGYGAAGCEWDAAAEGDDFEAADVGSGLRSCAWCEEDYFMAAVGEFPAQACHVGNYAAVVGEIVW